MISKSIVLVCLSFVFFTSSLFSQSQLESFRFRVTDISASEWNKSSQSWGEWFTPDLRDAVVNTLIILDLPNQKFSFYTQSKTSEWDVTHLYPTEEKANGTYMQFDCVDKDNLKCLITLVFPATSPKMPFLYTTYPEFKLCYFLKML